MTNPSKQTSRRRRALSGLLLSATAVTGALAIAAASAPAQAASTTTATAHAASSVPWRKVGSSWIMATWAPNAKSAQTVFLIGPDGARYKITGVGRYARVLDWTTSRGGRMLVETALGIREINMRTGARHTIHGFADTEVFGYERPGANAVLAEKITGTGNDPLVRVGLNGKRLTTYPTTVKGAGSVGGTPVAVRTSTAIIVGADHGLVELGEHGRVLHKFATSLGGCNARSLLRRGVVVANCGKAGVLYAVPLSGGRATRLTGGADKENPFGYLDLWNYSAGRLGLSPNGCGPSSLVRYDSAGDGTRIYPKAPVAGTGATDYIGHRGDLVEAIFHRGQCMGTAATLFTWNAVTGRSTALLGPGVNGGSVTGVVPSAFDRVNG